MTDEAMRLDILEVDGPRVWPYFARHHYLPVGFNGHRSFMAVVAETGEPVAFESIIRFPHPHITRGWRGHRLVVLPDFQGLGLGGRITDWCGEYVHQILDGRFFVRMLHPRMGEYCGNSPLWIPTQGNMKVLAATGKSSGIGHIAPLQRPAFAFEYVGPSGEKKFDPRSGKRRKKVDDTSAKSDEGQTRGEQGDAGARSRTRRRRVAERGAGVQPSSDKTVVVAEEGTENGERNVNLSGESAPEAQTPDVPETRLTLYPYQDVGVRFLQTAVSALMADEMGVGKSVQTIEMLRRTGALPALIVARSSVKATWEREFKKWAPELRVVVAPSGTAKATTAILKGEFDVLVVSWDAIRSLSRLARFGSVRVATCVNCDPTSTGKPTSCEREPRVLNDVEWKTVVADEAHRGKDPHAKQTRALWALGDAAERRIALTGTPIANSPEDLWSVMRFVSPQEYPAKTTWLDRYGLKVPNYFSGFDDVVGFRPDRREEFDTYFLPRFIRRLTAQVQPDLPASVYERRDVEMKGKQAAAYKAMKKEMLAEVDGGMLFAENALVQVGRLRQLAVSHGEMQGDDFVLTEPSAHLDEMENILDDLGPDRQVVVFADSRQLLDLAEERLKKSGIEYGAITGRYNEDQRALFVDQFGQGKSRVMLVQESVGGEGIDGLQVADVGVFLERPWSSVLNKQCEGRLRRIGQEGDSILFIDVVATDTIQERVFEVLEQKAAKLEDLVKDEETMRRWLA